MIFLLNLIYCISLINKDHFSCCHERRVKYDFIQSNIIEIVMDLTANCLHSNHLPLLLGLIQKLI